MKVCKRCDCEMSEEDFGGQRYCRKNGCWQKYKTERRQARRYGRRLSEVNELRRLNTRQEPKP